MNIEGEVQRKIDVLNKECGLEIDVRDLVVNCDMQLMLDLFDEISYNVRYLLSLGFGTEDGTDILQRFPGIFMDDRELFCEKVNGLMARMRPNFMENVGKDMSCWEELL